MRKFYQIILTTIFSVAGALLINIGTANASVDRDAILEKWTFTQYYNCSNLGRMGSPIVTLLNGEVYKDDIYKIDGIDVHKGIYLNSPKDIALPSYQFEHSVGYNDGDHNSLISCQEMFGGANGYSGAASYSNTNYKNINWSQSASAEKMLEDLGYELSSKLSAKEINITARASIELTGTADWFSDGTDDGAVSTIPVTLKEENGKTIAHVSDSANSQFFKTLKVSVNDNVFSIYVTDLISYLAPHAKIGDFSIASCDYQPKNRHSISVSLNQSMDNFLKDLKSKLSNATIGFICSGTYGSFSHSYTFSFDDTLNSIQVADTGIYTYKHTYSVANDVISKMSGKNIKGNFLTNSELYALYFYYLDKSIDDSVQNRFTCDELDNTTNLTKIQLKNSDGEFQDDCYVNFNTSNPKSYMDSIKVYTQKQYINTAQPYATIEPITLREVVNWFNSVDTSTLDDVDGLDQMLAQDDYKNESVDCLSSGAAENLGWIICPILNFADQVSQDLYEQLIVPALQIKPGLFQVRDGSNDDTYDAWTIFQGFANTIFVIFFLFVIFSQVTGVGIDNYGIKKIMPKLIIAAILVNLSYIICQVCVDLSNIIGNGIQSIFNELSDNVTISATIGGQNIGNQIGSTMISAVGIAGAAYLAYVTWAVWLLPLIVAIIGAIISILFLFILLAGRQAIIVLLVVISPLAFVCYLLPNTKKLFDKYIKIGEVMLLLYPICGLVVAGGSYVSKLLLSIPSGELDLFYAFTAMIISIAPIFFIPKLVKSSFGALGSVGATLSGLGARLSGKAKSGIKSSGAYKAGQERLNEAQTRWRAGVDSNGNPLKMNFGRRLARGSFFDRNIARSRAQYNKDQDARLAESKLLDSDYMMNEAEHRRVAASNEREKMYSDIYDRETDIGRVETALTDALAGKDAEKASAALLSLIKKGGIDEAFKALSAPTTNWSTMDSNVRNRIVQAMGNSGIDAMKAYSVYRNTNGGASFGDWVSGKISSTQRSIDAGNGVKSAYSSYAQHLKQNGGVRAMVSYSKDEMGLIKSNMDGLKGELGGDMFGAMLGNAEVNSNDSKAQVVTEQMLKHELSKGRSLGGLDVEQLGWTTEDLSNLRDEGVTAVLGGVTKLFEDNVPGISHDQAVADATNLIRGELGSSIGSLDARTLGKMRPSAKKLFGVDT